MSAPGKTTELSLWQYAIPGRASIRRISSACSMHFTPRSPAAWGWGCRFAGLSSAPMGADEPRMRSEISQHEPVARDLKHPVGEWAGQCQEETIAVHSSGAQTCVSKPARPLREKRFPARPLRWQFRDVLASSSELTTTRTHPSCCHLSSRAPIFAANVARDQAWRQKGLANRYWRLRRHRCLRENPARCRGGR